MRISDWSSDVCSSDLDPVLPVAAAQPASAPERAPQSLVEYTGSTAYAVAATGWQLMLGAYYLGGEFVETGRIMGTHAAGMLGVVTISTEPGDASAELSNPVPEDASGAAWMRNGGVDHKPARDTAAEVGRGSCRERGGS